MVARFSVVRVGFSCKRTSSSPAAGEGRSAPAHGHRPSLHDWLIDQEIEQRHDFLPGGGCGGRTGRRSLFSSAIDSFHLSVH